MQFINSQYLFVEKGTSTPITVITCNDDAVDMVHLQPLLNSANGVLGVAANYGDQCKLSSIAFATLSWVVVINVPTRRVNQSKKKSKQQRVATGNALIQTHLLCNSQLQKYAFEMDRLAVALFLDLSVRINRAIDMLSVTTNDSRQSMEALMNALGGEVNLHKKNVQSLFFGNPDSQTVDVTTRVALEAWAACRAATLPHMSPRFASLPRVDTMAFPKAHLGALANISRHADRLEALKPTAVKNDVKGEFKVKKGDINLTCDRFPTRIKKSKNQVVKIEMEGKGATNQVVGRARKIDGRNARISVNGPVQGNKILSVTTIGKDNPTCAESVRQDIILSALQHKSKILSNPFFQALWLPEKRPEWPESKERKNAMLVNFSRGLNASQHAAVRSILSDKANDRIVMIQGPPGTGKTTVIAASVNSYSCADPSQCIWVAAQSNVAVKNIAEKFFSTNFRNFKLLVSKDFHFDWHEHLYHDVEKSLIRSDRFKMSIVEASRVLLDCKVILCTLSMFSNPNIDVFLRLVPVQMVILDEASQIECGDYLPILDRFHSTLQKLVFIGDDKQLPPYGQEDIPNLRSVFEFSHIRKRALLLNTQYRMPHVIGNFISKNVYGNKLLTLLTPTTSQACRFIDVNRGREVKRGHSWMNLEEARMVIELARSFETEKMSFRIITPYDGQRSHIEDLLKREKLQWEDKVFNVDSFQGNEDEHIIISVVRSNGPGFLRNLRRTNVMLTRCKKSMVICSSRAFLSGKGSGTLVGKLAASVNKENWINGDDILKRRVVLN